MRFQYAVVAALYRQAGNQDEALKKMEIAEEAMRTLIKENPWFAMMEINQTVGRQLALDDFEGVKRLTALTPPEFWLHIAEQVVTRVLSSGDVESAEDIAKRVLSRKSGFASPRLGDRNQFISCFIEAGEMGVALEIEKTGQVSQRTASACEAAGRAMIQKDRGRLLKTSPWKNEIGAFQRVYLSLGAASMH